MIVQMHELERPLKTVHEHGPLRLELLLKAKSAVGLCRDCFDALEAMEPAIQTRLGESPCKPGF